MTRYLMNSATIPHGCAGWFSYCLATIEDLVAFLQEVCQMGHNPYGQEEPDGLFTLRRVTEG